MKNLEKEHVKKVNDKYYFSTWALCKALGVTQQTLSLWASQGCPKADRGWWPITDVLTWRGILPIKVSDEETTINKLEARVKELEALLLKNNRKGGKKL